MQPAVSGAPVLCRTNPENVSGAQGQRGCDTGQGGRFHPSCPRQLPSPPSSCIQPSSWRWPWGLWTHAPTPSRSGQTLYNASSHSGSPACDRPGAAERTRRVQERERGFPGVWEGGCPALLPADIIRGGFSWPQSQATPQFSRPCGQCASRTWGDGWQVGRAQRLQVLPRPEGGSSRWLDA